MDMTTKTSYYNAKQLNSSQRMQLALDSIKESQSVHTLANEKNVSRKFVYKQKHKAMKAVNDVFQISTDKPAPIQ